MTPTRIKLLLIVASAAINGLVLAGWTQEWFTVTLIDATVLPVGGESAAPALSALALTGIALLGAIAIAGPFFRVVLGSLQALIGVAVIASAAVAMGDPAAASAQLISKATGVAGADSTAALIGSVSQGIWPWLVVVAGALAIVLAVAIVVTARNWPGSSRKYQAVRLEPADARGSAIDDWDALSDGADPTSR